ncbi:hypothetical protein [Bradyrhizobium sp. CSS354]|uniref:hypothetical protein n=1 Tax=Bradyrhizobium sp. CSS354 TaxID=2699172 RepID=UPI0023B09765|nr:hypothetical protein [Bradyrhizobium sp. CSS354]
MRFVVCIGGPSSSRRSGIPQDIIAFNLQEAVAGTGLVLARAGEVTDRAKEPGGASMLYGGLPNCYPAKALG